MAPVSEEGQGIEMDETTTTKDQPHVDGSQANRAAPATAPTVEVIRAFTPGPWVIDEGDPLLEGNVYSSDRTGSIVATCKGFQFAPRPRAEVLANARFIVRACNSHEALVTALKECSFRLATLVAASGDFSDANATALDRATQALTLADGQEA